MKTIRTLTALALLVLAMLSCILPVFADVIVEPEDAFYRAHADECVYNRYRTYTVNTEVGHAYVYVSPDSSLTVKGWPNGTEVVISWIYTDKNGDDWGLFSQGGWFRMADLTVVYDSFSFIEDHREEMTGYTEGSYTLEASEEKPIPMWSYPGKRSDAAFNSDNIAEYISMLYTDGDGVVWGYISYYKSRRNIWVCASDPYGDGTVTPADPALSEWKAEPTPAGEIPMSEGNVKLLLAVGALVCTVVVVTAVVISVRFKKKENTAEEKTEA